MSKLGSNIAAVFLASVVCCGISVILNRYTPFRAPYWYVSIIFLALFSFISNAYLGRKNTPHDERPQASYMLTGVVIRLILSLFYLLVLWLLLESAFFSAAIHFLAYYTLFSIAEIRYLSSVASRKF